MRTATIVLCLVNFVSALLGFAGKLAERQHLIACEEAWGTFIGLLVVCFLFTWVATVIGVIICGLVSEATRGKWLPVVVYPWLVISGAMVAWLVVGSLAFVFPGGRP